VRQLYVDLLSEFAAKEPAKIDLVRQELERRAQVPHQRGNQPTLVSQEGSCEEAGTGSR
jgi:hypothetical protein